MKRANKNDEIYNNSYNINLITNNKNYILPNNIKLPNSIN